MMFSSHKVIVDAEDPPVISALGACTVTSPAPSVHRRGPSEWHLLRSRLPRRAGHQISSSSNSKSAAMVVMQPAPLAGPIVDGRLGQITAQST